VSAIRTLLRTHVSLGSTDLDGGDLLAVVPLVGSLVAGLLAYPALPAEMAVHFSGGAPDQFVAKAVGVWLVPVIGLGAVAVSRRQSNYPGPFRAVLLGFVGWVVALAHGYVLAWNLGYRFSSLVVLVPAIGGSLVVVFLQKTDFGS
jgi:uncharacterized membrane protein